MKSALLIKVAEIPEHGLQFQINHAEPRFAKILAELAEGNSKSTSGTASFAVSPWPDRVDVEGSLAATLPASCSRCASTFLQEVERGFLRVYLRSEPEDLSEDMELSSDDLDRDLLPDDKLDLGELLGEELVLALPSKPLCMDDCKGICAGCGAELNERECSCEPETDHRWASLKGLNIDE
jgi:uncharacterized protein